MLITYSVQVVLAKTLLEILSNNCIDPDEISLKHVTFVSLTFSLCQQYRDRPACIFVQSDSLSVLLADKLKLLNSHLNIPKNDNAQFQKWKVGYSIVILYVNDGTEILSYSATTQS